MIRNEPHENNSPRIFELDESKWRPASILQINKCDFPVLVKQILDVLCADVWRKITHVNSALGLVRHAPLFFQFASLQLLVEPER